MSLPNYLAKIKSSGVYRFTWDKSVVPAQQAETLRLVIGYSEKGPFNTPVYIESASDFKSIYGNINKRLERKGCYFHRMATQALQSGPILAMNIKPFDKMADTEGNEKVSYAQFNGTNITAARTDEGLPKIQVSTLYKSNRFWNLDADKLIERIGGSDANSSYITLAATDTKETSCTIVMRPIENSSYKGITVRSWCASQGIEVTGYLEDEAILNEDLSKFFAEIYVFRGKFDESLYASNGPLVKYIDTDGKVRKTCKNALNRSVDALEAMSRDSNSNFIGSYSGCILPYFKDANGNYASLDLKFNADYNNHKMLMKFDSDLLDTVNEPIKILIDDKDLPVVNDDNKKLYDEQGKGFYPMHYFEGYTYLSINKNQPIWNQCKSVFDDEGIYEALTNRVDVEYHYIVDTFDTEVGETKGELFSMAKDKDNAFAIVNFPKMSKFLKDITMENAAAALTMPGETEGASWGAYYTQLTFTDGTVKNVIPSAALVSNLFMQKWGPRQPYYIVAGPNYGTLTYSGLVGPDYNFSRSDLDILEPKGINAIVYVPRLGTYISSNQTAKQIPVSGLSKVHIRELVIYLQNEIEHLLQSYQWELNTQALRDTIKTKADAICDKIMNNGGIYAYVNICDETNNTQEVIDNEMIILDTEIEPARGAGKMVHQLTIHKTGGLTSSIK